MDFKMITLKEIKRRFKSEAAEDVSWVVHASLVFMGIVGIILLALICYFS